MAGNRRSGRLRRPPETMKDGVGPGDPTHGRLERRGSGDPRAQRPGNCRSRDPSRTRGVTLLELLVAMAIASVTLVVSLQLYVATQRAIDRQQVKAARLGQESDLLSLLRRDIREASLVAPESTESRLVLVNLDGGRVTYGTEGETVRREAPEASYAWPMETLALAPRFEYPAGRGESGRLVRVTWGPSEAPRALTLNLRNRPM